MVRLGLRGAAMILCAYIWTMIGLAVVLGPPRPGMRVPHESLPLWLRAASWFIPAGLALALAWSKRLDWLALGALMVGPMVNITSYTASWVLHLCGRPGLADGWQYAALYLSCVGIVALTAAVRRPAADPDQCGNR